MAVSKRQIQVLKFIKTFVEENGYPPTLEEIRKGLKLSAKSLVSYHIQSLEAEGYLIKIPGKPRGIQVVGFASAKR